MNDLTENRTNHFASELTYSDEKAAWALTIEMVGVTKENVKIDTADSYLNITGEKTKGFNKGRFELHYAMPEGIDESKIEAQFEDGVLVVTIPMSAKKTAKEITIK